MSQLTMENLTVGFGHGRDRVVALDDFSLAVDAGEMVVLLGPSGCGKSTVLNAVAGLIEPEAGRIATTDAVLYDRERGVNVPPNRRQLGMVFQSYSLWPHLDVYGNVEFPLKARRVGKSDRADRVTTALRRVQMEDLAKRHPGELSGGQQQRVALARALVAENDVVLFDEPLSNLDTRLRLDLRDEIGALHQRLGFTALYVTHDQVEALSLASRVVVMRSGRIEQIGAPEDVYGAPASAYVARFLGANVFAGRVADGDASTIVTAFGAFALGTAVERGITGDVVVAVFPQHIRLRPAAGGPATVTLAKFVGASREYTVESGGERLSLTLPTTEVFRAGDRVEITVAPDCLHVYGDADVTAIVEELDEAVDGAVPVAP